MNLDAVPRKRGKPWRRHQLMLLAGLMILPLTSARSEIVINFDPEAGVLDILATEAGDDVVLSTLGDEILLNNQSVFSKGSVNQSDVPNGITIRGDNEDDDNIFIIDATLFVSDFKGVTLIPIPVTLDGGGGDDILIGFSGNETIIGGAGDDLLIGQGGADDLDGRIGDDILDGGNDDDNLNGGAGFSYLFGGQGNDTIFIQSGRSVVDPEAGSDTMDFRYLSSVSFDLDQLDGDQIVGAEVVDGGDKGNLITPAIVTIEAPPESVAGTSGDDYFYLRSLEFARSVDGGAGTDVVGYHKGFSDANSTFTSITQAGKGDITLAGIEEIRDVVNFNFNNNAEGWAFTSPAAFVAARGAYSPVKRWITLFTSDNSNTFGFYESPLIARTDALVKGNASTHQLSIDGGTGPNALYRATYEIHSNQDTSITAPTFRTRVSSENFQRSSVNVVTSVGDGSLAPTKQEQAYRNYFTLPVDTSNLRLDFDVLNWDAADSPTGAVAVDRVVVESFLVSNDLDAGSDVASYDFSTGDNGFTPRDASDTSPLAAPESFSTDGGLTIAGTVSGASTIPIFGYFGLESGDSIGGSTLYRTRWQVSSSATAVTASKLPAIRLRINDSSQQFGALTVVESTDPTGLPLAGSPATFDLWFESPGTLGGNTLIYSFDYLYVPGTDNDPSLSITLDSLTVRAYNIPGPAPINPTTIAKAIAANH